MNISEYISDKRSKATGDDSGRVVKRITCADGFALSVQASDGHYCEPRTNEGPWTKVEVGYPTGIPKFITKYRESTGSYTEAIYAYTPIELVEKLIKKHGGIALEGATP